MDTLADSPSRRSRYNHVRRLLPEDGQAWGAAHSVGRPFGFLASSDAFVAHRIRSDPPHREGLYCVTLRSRTRSEHARTIRQRSELLCPRFLIANYRPWRIISLD